MALTLLINGRPLPAPDARGLTEGAGAVRAGQVFVMSDSLRDALLAAAAELRGITRSAAAPEEEKPRMRLKLQTPLHLLLERGHIRKMQHQAGHEIGRVMEAIAGGGPALAQNRYGETISGGRRPTSRCACCLRSTIASCPGSAGRRSSGSAGARPTRCSPSRPPSASRAMARTRWPALWGCTAGPSSRASSARCGAIA
ncbi:hypothetical protein [Teichococcus aestuarii]|uniref:hypothetical protein n=1 Tax=Teichococcus aestuarii TaxID=568898 RepID=UPI00360E8BB7